jgi:hypothetical protein
MIVKIKDNVYNLEGGGRQLDRVSHKCRRNHGGLQIRERSPSSRNTKAGFDGTAYSFFSSTKSIRTISST